MKDDPAPSDVENDKPTHGNDGHDKAGLGESKDDSKPGALSLPWGGAPPAPLGSPHAYQAVGEVAAPLLAGFSVTLIGVISQSPDSVRWAGWSMLMLTMAVGLLLAAVQCGFHARQMYWTRDDLLPWFVSLTALSDETFRDQHRDHRAEWERYVNWTRRSYNLGIITLLVGLATILFPPEPYDGKPLADLDWVARAAAAVLALMIAAFELVWWVQRNRKRAGK